MCCARRANSSHEPEQIFPVLSRVFYVWNMWEMLALFYFFFSHVFGSLTFHSVFREPVRGSQNAGGAVIYSAALWRLTHSRCGKKKRKKNIRLARCGSAYCIIYSAWLVYCAPGGGIFIYCVIVFFFFFFLLIYFSFSPSLILTYWTRTSCFAKCNWDTPHTPKNKQTKKWFA